MSHWQKYPSRWNTLTAPLRPDGDVVAAIARLAAANRERVLLLGVTPELARVFDVVTAVDKNPAMVRDVWPGDSADKQALVGDWLDIALAPGSFAAVVGDGSLNVIRYPEEPRRVLARAMAFLKPGGRFVCRLFERPQSPFTREHLVAITSGPSPVNFHAFKWMLAMHLAGSEGTTVHVTRILEAFETLFPDRDALARRTGWAREAIDTIDVYRNSPIVYCFPNRQEFDAVLPEGAVDVTYHACGRYDLADCCPILSFARGG